MIFGINTTCDISKLSQITYNNFEISLVVFMPNITTNHAITYTNFSKFTKIVVCWGTFLFLSHLHFFPYMRLLLFKFPHFCYFPWNSFSYHIYLAGFFKTLSPNGPFASNRFFRPKITSKVPTIKAKSATIVFFLFSSFPFPSLPSFWSFSSLKNLPFDAFSLKWLQISLG